MGNRNRPDGGVGSDVGIDNAEIYLVTANSFVILKNWNNVSL